MLILSHSLSLVEKIIVLYIPFFFVYVQLKSYVYRTLYCIYKWEYGYIYVACRMCILWLGRHSRKHISTDFVAALFE